ncbi:unnamed protein product [Vicia faba]|uniref:Epidermal patterning factor-like protein n=1 Tax=Vicia faba TaxID=3906 RepID=A0AAV0ZTR7_VICFA|nr:unnamed protein product [Vicia faba]CAI8601145.1 unnamed protein product [Vicia faba]CAI8601146.1 unnamed protein product [Vicia faba]
MLSIFIACTTASTTPCSGIYLFNQSLNYCAVADAITIVVAVVAACSRCLMFVESDISIQASNPPDCKHRCLKCTPCVAVLVQVPPIDSTESYPEAWKCKCGGVLYPPNDI